MWFLLIYFLVPGVQAQQEKIRTVLRGTNSPCTGRLEVYHNKEWGSVCHHQWNTRKDKNGQVVCESLGCGEHLNSDYVNNLPIINTKDSPPPSTMWMDEVKCNGTESSIWECNATRGNISLCNRDHQYIVVQCLGSIKLSLNMNGNKNNCAGVVQFDTPYGVASVCNIGWNAAKADKVCKELECGKHERIPKLGTLHGNSRGYNVPLDCIGKETFSWQCVDWATGKFNGCPGEVSVICSNHKSMRLSGKDVCSGVLEEKCKGNWTAVPYTDEISHRANDICSSLRCGKSNITERHGNSTILKCTDRVKVQLTGNCFGDLRVSVNESRLTVCNNDLNADEQKQIGAVVCKQLGCGKLLKISGDKQSTRNERLSQVDCTGNEDSLWECLAKQEPPGDCVSTNVLCAAFEKVQLQDGYGRCSGRLEVKLAGSWWRVHLTSEWKTTESDVVCKQLGCGKSQTTENNMFVESNHEFLRWKLKCSKNHNNLSECLDGLEEIPDPNLNLKPLKSVNIICTGQEFYVLQGNQPCEGTALVESGGKTTTLTVEEDKWNEMANKICKQMHCGTALPKNQSPISDVPLCSYSTSDPTSTPTSYQTSDPTSVPTSDQTSNPTSNSTSNPKSDPTSNSPSNPTLVKICIPMYPLDLSSYIKCTGSGKLKLTNVEGERCWGKVEVCNGTKCEGVCSDTWKSEQSNMLCENLNCGTAIQGVYIGPKLSNPKGTVTIGSVYCPKETKEISQCNFAYLNQSTCQNPAYVACTGSVKAKLTDPRKKCAGKPELFYQGLWHSVCSDSIKTIKDSICKTIGCGKALSDSQSNRSDPIELLMSNIKCSTDNFTSCTGTVVKSCSVAHLKCEDWRRLLIPTDDACSGRVYAESKDNTLHVVSTEGWNKKEGEVLCQYLECGNYINYTSGALEENDMTYPVWNKRYNCSNSKNIWGCEIEENPTMLQPLAIQCDGKPEIKLKEKCTGQVIIKQKGVQREQYVCWNSQDTGTTENRVFNELCHQLQCSPFIAAWENQTAKDGRRFECSGNENNLWQCSSSKKKCTSVVSLSCADAVQFKFTEECGGNLKVNYREKWELAFFNSESDANIICEHMKCGKGGSIRSESWRTEYGTTLFQCGNNEKRPKYCVKPALAQSSSNTGIKCEKYNPPKGPSLPNIGLIVGLVGGLIFLLLAIVIVIWQRKRFMAMLSRAARERDVELSSNEMENLKDSIGLPDRKSSMFEMDDYEDADLIMNIGDKSQGLHPSEEDKRSSSGDSSRTEYDDVEERNVKPFESENSRPTEPLLPPRPDNLQGNVRYEVELEADDQDDYDDAAPAPVVLSDPGESPEPVVSLSADMSEGMDEQVRQTDE